MIPPHSRLINFYWLVLMKHASCLALLNVSWDVFILAAAKLSCWKPVSVTVVSSSIYSAEYARLSVIVTGHYTSDFVCNWVIVRTKLDKSGQALNYCWCFSPFLMLITALKILYQKLVWANNPVIKLKCHFDSTHKATDTDHSHID